MVLNNKKLIVIWFLLIALFFQGYAIDYLAADTKSGVFRNGVIDPVILMIPVNIQVNMAENPHIFLNDLITFLKKDKPDDFLLIKRIHDWITHTIAYDDDFFYGNNKGSNDPLLFLSLQRTTRGGYAQLFKELAEIAGFEAQYITGFTKTYYARNKKRNGKHAWNAVKIYGKWYIVDTSGDHRFRFSNGKFTEKTNYMDTKLFINPAEYALIRFADNPEQLFFNDPPTPGEFLAAPNIKLLSRIYGIHFKTNMSPLIKKEFRKSPNSTNVEGIVDVVPLKQEKLEILLQVPNHISIQVKMIGENGKTYYLNSIAYRQNEDVICSFSPPESGKFNAYINAKSHEENTYKTIYNFEIVSDSTGILFPIEKGILYSNSLMDYYNVTINQGILTDKSFHFEIRFPETIIVEASLRDTANDAIKGNVNINSDKGLKQYSFQRGPVIRFIKVFAREKEKKDRFLIGIIKI